MPDGPLKQLLFCFKNEFERAQNFTYIVFEKYREFLFFHPILM
jgi:hypothetical protein